MEIDKLIVGALKGLASTGIYGVTTLIGTVITIPQRSISAISAPIMSEAMSNNDMVKVKELYTKTSLTQFVAGILIFLLVWFNVDSIFSLMRNDYTSGKNVVLIISVMNLFKMAGGMNHSIILFSKYYKFNFYSNWALLALTIVNNLIFIPIYDITGAAMATSFTIILFIILKLIFVWVKFKMLPFTFGTLKTLLIFGIISMVLYLFPFFDNVFFDVPLRTATIILIFSVLVLVLRVSDDISEYYNKLFKKLRSLLKI